MLRNDISYRKSFYYGSMVVNFCLRFLWMMSFVNYATDKFLGRFHLFHWFAMFAEIIRRTLWSLIRVEWEYVKVYKYSS